MYGVGSFLAEHVDLPGEIIRSVQIQKDIEKEEEGSLFSG